MPEYLAPGVYVEETSFRAKSIEGVGTSTTGCVGPTRKGPIAGTPGHTPELLTSFGDFVRIYGGPEDLILGGGRRTNYLAHSVLHYFNEGGVRLYVSRVNTQATGGTAAVDVVANADALEQARFVARFPGDAGSGQIQVKQVKTPAATDALRGAQPGTLLRSGTPNIVNFVKVGSGEAAWNNGTADVPQADVPMADARFITVNVVATDKDGNQMIYEEMGLDRRHPRFIGDVLKVEPSRRSDYLDNLFALQIGDNVTAAELQTGLFPSDQDENTFKLTGGSDGGEPELSQPDVRGSYAAALAELAGIEDIAIVAAPGAADYPSFEAVQGALIGHAERSRAYRIAVLDTRKQLTPGQAREAKARIDSTKAALYYPWITVANPLARPGAENAPREINLPPSGFVCGIYARNDVINGVHKAPANEVVRDALRFESDVNFAQQQVLNPIGVNCLRYFPGRGFRIWGARTASSDPEWKYVNVRRYLLYLEASIDRGTQWAVFENNGERLWANIRETVSAFLYNEWVSGALLGSTPEEAFFVRCDRSTMTQNDLDNGRLICLIGVAALKPAEFVIFRIGQKTVDARA